MQLSVSGLVLFFCLVSISEPFFFDLTPEDRARNVYNKREDIDAYGDEASLQEMPWVLNIPYRTDFTKRSSTELNTLISLLMKKLSPATQAGRPSSFRFGAGRK
ncbi:hypothetical protein CHS0354_029305 [Potamilus streckersoni]|uniref:Uncharacterized protein n=1 Tax=Potamilus streckersoni TaxID=2493646 RepID=A0AAE0W3U4_9BIVA|nr:hypothetical protein CHS0354_029305 [Potamilus streckersoni]